MGVCAHVAAGRLGELGVAERSAAALSPHSRRQGLAAPGAGVCGIGSFVEGCGGVGACAGRGRDHRTGVVLSVAGSGRLVAARAGADLAKPSGARRGQLSAAAGGGCDGAAWPRGQGDGMAGACVDGSGHGGVPRGGVDGRPRGRRVRSLPIQPPGGDSGRPGLRDGARPMGGASGRRRTW